MLSALPFPQIDPVAIEIGPFAIRWYALAYIAGLLIGWRYCRALARRSPFNVTAEHIDDLLLWATLGVVLGGRIGYIVFYQPGFFLSHPLQILYLWQGGMSFHGGMLGVLVGSLLYARKHRVRFLALTDIVSCAAPIGLFLGRVANFVNGELFGRVAPDVPWAMRFPGGGPLPRHPSQLYEAGLEGIVLFAVLFALVRLGGLGRAGLLSGCFLAGYGAARFVAEFFRAPDPFLGYLAFDATMGQLLSLPMIAVGVAIALWARRRAAAP